MNRNKLLLLICVSTLIALLTTAVLWWLDIPSLPNLDPEVHAPQAANLFAELGPADERPIEGFQFTLQLVANTSSDNSPYDHYHELRVDGMQLQVIGLATNQIPGDKIHGMIEIKQRVGPGLIDLLATKDGGLAPEPVYP